MKKGLLFRIIGIIFALLPPLIVAATAVCYIIWTGNWAILILGGICTAAVSLPCGMIATVMGALSCYKYNKKWVGITLGTILILLGVAESVVGALLLSIPMR